MRQEYQFNDDVIFYQTNGIAVNNLRNVKTKFYIQENIGRKLFDSRYFYEGDSVLYELQSLCGDLHDVFAKRIFGDLQLYEDSAYVMPYGLVSAGMDSDCNMSKEEFQKYFDYHIMVSDGTLWEVLTAL